MFVRYQNYNYMKLGGGADKRGGNLDSRLRYSYMYMYVHIQPLACISTKDGWCVHVHNKKCYVPITVAIVI